MIFEQRDRWLEEMREQLQRKESVTSHLGYMDLVSIASEIVNAASDERKQTSLHIPNWKSLREDLADSLSYFGPELHGEVGACIGALIMALDDVIQTKTMSDGARKPYFDEARRGVLQANADQLLSKLVLDDTVVAAWRDFVTACRADDFTQYPCDRVSFLRDTVVELQKYRRHRHDYFGILDTACSVLFDSRVDVARGQRIVGDPPIEVQAGNSSLPSGLSLDDRIDLAERLIVAPPLVGDYIVWLRVDKAYIPSIGNVEFGDITLYPAVVLAGVIRSPERIREEFSIVPTELINEAAQEAQSSHDEGTKNLGFEHKPGMVYARIVLRGVEEHLAGNHARRFLGNLLAYLDVEPQTWEMLRGELKFKPDSAPWSQFSYDWGPKYPLQKPVYPDNDTVYRQLKEIRESGFMVSSEVSDEMDAALNLLRDLRDAPDSEALVMAAVRAIEHCNSWATAGRKDWAGFISAYLLDGITRFELISAASDYLFKAIVVTRPDISPSSPEDPELAKIRDEATGEYWEHRFNLDVAFKNVSVLKEKYSRHPLFRPLAELDSTLKRGKTIGATINHIQARVLVRVNRLTRARNAAVHGGPLSYAACDSIAEFARMVAEDALVQVLRAKVEGVPVSGYMQERRTRNAQALSLLRETGHYGHLF
jgi:hypothetical protein